MEDLLLFCLSVPNHLPPSLTEAKHEFGRPTIRFQSPICIHLTSICFYQVLIQQYLLPLLIPSQLCEVIDDYHNSVLVTWSPI